MSGYIQVFDVKKEFELIWEYEMGDMSWMKWHVVANVLFAGAESGETYVWLMPSGDCKVLQGNGNKSEVGQLTPDGKSLIVGYTDGCVKLWNIKSSSVVQSYEPFTALGHSDAITALAAVPDNKRFLSGSVDGKIMLANNVGPLCNFSPNAGSIEALTMAPGTDSNLFVSGTLKGKISIWDVNRQAIRLEACDGPVGITKILWPTESFFICGTLNGTIQVYDPRDGRNVVCKLNRITYRIISLLLSNLNIFDYSERLWDMQLIYTTLNTMNGIILYLPHLKMAQQNCST